MDKGFSGKIRCVSVPNLGDFTKGKIYDVTDGVLSSDFGKPPYECWKYKTLEEINTTHISQFELVEEVKYFNGKIRCIKAGSDTFKIWEVYEIKNGELLLENGGVFKKEIKSLDDIKHLKSKFELVEEPDFQKSLEHI